jgi:hypothetical protein
VVVVGGCVVVVGGCVVVVGGCVVVVGGCVVVVGGCVVVVGGGVVVVVVGLQNTRTSFVPGDRVPTKVTDTGVLTGSTIGPVEEPT